MEEQKGIFNIGDLAQPVTKLIEKVADAAGVLYEPRKIKRLAKAQAEADLIKAKSDIEITDLQNRGLYRFVQEEGKKQENLEGVIEKTIPLLDTDAKPQEMDDDWVMNFFDKAKLISDEEMQTLWAKILAGEANQPNSFSKRTVNFLSTIDKKDAEVFSKLCRFNVKISGETYSLVYEVNNPIYNNLGVDYANLMHLDSIGLIRFNNLSRTSITETDDIAEITCSYFDIHFQILPKDKQNYRIDVGFVMLTQLGLEISKLCETEKVADFLGYIIDQFDVSQRHEIRLHTEPTGDTEKTSNSVSISESETDFVKIYNSVIDGGEF